jgi:hypothetical protein
MTKEETPSPEHLAWVIDGRARNQVASLKLYKLMLDYKEQIRKKSLATDVQDLAAVCFSLWRAVFLADRTGKIQAKMTDAETFVAKMLTDNAIAFAQDRNAREWTFNYYIDNALFRLRDYYENRTAQKGVVLKPPKGSRTPQERWDYLQAALEKAVSLLEKKLRTKNSN